MQTESALISRRRRGALLLLFAFVVYAVALLVTAHRHGVLGMAWGYSGLDYHLEAEQPVNSLAPGDAEYVLGENDVILQMRPQTQATLGELRTGDFVYVRYKHLGTEHESHLQLKSPFDEPPILIGSISAFTTPFVFMLVGFYCFYRQPLNEGTRLFFGVCAAFSASGLLVPLLAYLGYRGIDPFGGQSLYDFLLALQAYALIGVALPSLAHLVLVFPEPAPVLRRHPQLPRAIRAAYALVVVLIASPRAVHYLYHWARRTDAVVLLTVIAGFVLAGIAVVQGWALLRGGSRSWLRKSWRQPVATAVWLGAAGAASVWCAMAASKGHAGVVENAIDRYDKYLLLAALLASLVVIAVVLVRQYRRSDGIARLQIRWPLGGILTITTGVVAMNVLLFFTRGFESFASLEDWQAATLVILLDVSILSLPVSVAFAGTKYKLWRANSALATWVVIVIAFFAGLLAQYAVQAEAEARLAARFGTTDDNVRWAIGLGVTVVAAILAVIAKKTYSRIRGRRAVWEVLPSALRALSKARSAEDLARVVSEQGKELQCRAALLLPSGDAVTFAEPAADAAPPLRVVRRNLSYLAQPVLETMDDQRAFPRGVREAGYAMLAPVRGIDGIVGIIALTASRRGVFAEEETKFIAQFANEVGDKIQLLELRRSARRTPPALVPAMTRH